MDEKEFQKLVDERNYWRKMAEELSAIQNRDVCPHCQQKMPPKTETVAKILNAQTRVNTINVIINPEIQSRSQQMRVDAEQRAKNDRELKRLAEKMLIERKTDFTRILRAWKNGSKIELPVLSITEKTIWNVAMTQFIDRSDTYRDAEDDEILFFKI